MRFPHLHGRTARIGDVGSGSVHGFEHTLSYAGNKATRHAQGNDPAFSSMGNGRRDSYGGGREILSNLFSPASRTEENPPRRYGDHQDGGFGREGREGGGALGGRQS